MAANFYLVSKEVFLWLLDVCPKLYAAVKMASEGVDLINEIEEDIEKVREKLKELLQKIISFWHKIIDDFKEKSAKSRIYRRNRYKVNIPKMVFKETIQVSKDEIAEQVVNATISNELCYVLGSPFREKEKLIGDITTNLTSKGITCVVVNTKSKPYLLDEKSWYQGIKKNINHNLQYQFPALEEADYKHKADQSFMFKSYLESLVNKNEVKDIAIIINGLDIKVEKLAIKDHFAFRQGFFNIITHFYSKHNQNENYKKLRFILIGSANDDDTNLIFNEEQALFVVWNTKLDNFLKPKISIFTTLVNKYFKYNINIILLLQEIWEWTNGHPLQTQKIFQEIIKEKDFIKSSEEVEFVEKVIDRLYK